MACNLNIPLGASIRDPSLEAELQSVLDQGGRIYAVGDIHGHFATFKALIHRLRLTENDRVICLGDMIDRGPNSAALLSYLRCDPRMVCIKGNHEHYAIQSISPELTITPWQPWMERGGKSTYASYIVASHGDLWKAKERMLDDFVWLSELPTQIVLDHVRFVHAGYDPRMPIDMQGEKELLYIRKTWYECSEAVDPYRSVFFGHTTTTKMGEYAGEVAFSDHTLGDGRPAWVNLDVGAYNHVSPGLAAVDVTTFRVTKQSTLPCDRWFEPYEKKQLGKRKKVWSSPSTSKEAPIAEHFGLKALRTRANKPTQGEIRARMELAKSGVQLTSSDRDMTHLGYIIHRHKGKRIITPDTIVSTFNTGPTSFQVYKRVMQDGVFSFDSTPFILQRSWNVITGKSK